MRHASRAANRFLFVVTETQGSVERRIERSFFCQRNHQKRVLPLAFHAARWLPLPMTSSRQWVIGAAAFRAPRVQIIFASVVFYSLSDFSCRVVMKTSISNHIAMRKDLKHIGGGNVSYGGNILPRIVQWWWLD